MLNRVMLIGNLGADPVCSAVGNPNAGKGPDRERAVARFSMATSRQFTDSHGQLRKETDWHRVVCWGGLAEQVCNYLTKGRQVYVEGRLQTRSWEAPDGQKRWTTEVVATTIRFLGGPRPANGNVSNGKTEPEKQDDQEWLGEPSYEELPF